MFHLYRRELRFLISLSIFFSVSLLSNCAVTTEEPLSKEEITNICLNEKKKATAPEAQVNLTKSKKGSSVGFSLSFGSNFLKGVDPETVYINCIKELSY